MPKGSCMAVHGQSADDIAARPRGPVDPPCLPPFIEPHRGLAPVRALIDCASAGYSSWLSSTLDAKCAAGAVQQYTSRAGLCPWQLACK